MNGLQMIDHTCVNQCPTIGNKTEEIKDRKMIKQQKLMMNQKTVVHHLAQN